MKLHQVKIEFNAEHDRLLLRIATDDGKEVSLWLTRRCVRRMWPVLIDMARSSLDIALQSSVEAKAALLGMRHEQAMREADFSRPYDEARRERPLGSEPMLVARIQTRRVESANHVLSLLPTAGPGVNITLDDGLLHSFCRLLQNAVAKAEWDFALTLPHAMIPDSGGEIPTIN